MNDSEIIVSAEKNLERLLTWIGRLDTKFSIILGIETAMLGFLASVTPSLYCVVFLNLIITIFTFILLFLSFLFVCIGMFPRTKGPDQSLIFFGSISKMILTDYQSHFSSLEAHVYLYDVLEQCHINSLIINIKFSKLRLAYILLFISLLPWIYLVHTYR